MSRAVFDETVSARATPTIFFDGAIDDTGDGAVLLDNESGIELLVEHLVEHGHERIAILAGSQRESAGAARLRAFRAAMETHASPPEERFVKICEWAIADGRRAGVELLADPDPATAVLASSAELALGFMAAAADRGARIPEDIALVAFDDPYFGELLEPPLTAVAYDSRLIGATAADLLVDAMRSGTVTVSRELRHSGHARPAKVLRLHGGRRPVSDAAISFRAVTKRYGAHEALHPTDLEILEGEFFCLLGPSGCGKTTTLNLVGGFIGPTTGEILIRGQNVNRLPPYRRAVNTVFQNYALFPHMSVHDNVGFGLKMARISKRDAGTRIDEALALVGLEEFADRLPTSALGRPAAAGRGRAGAREPSRGAPAGRAARGARSQAAQAAADRIGADPS